MKTQPFILDVFLGVVASAGLLSLTAMAQSQPINLPIYTAPVVQSEPTGPSVQPSEQDQFQPNQSGDNQQYNNNDGQPMMPQNGEQNGEMGQKNFEPGNNMGPGNNPGPDNGQNQQQMDARRMKDAKREAANLEREYNMVNKAFDKLEKGGTVISQEIKDNLAKIKSAIDALKNASTPEELDNLDIGELHSMMGDLHQSQNEIMQKAQQFKDLQRNLKQMEQGVKMFERQLQSFSKQKIAVPVDIADVLSQLKTKIADIKNAKSADQLDSSTFDDLQELMQKLNDSRQQMEMLARWPQAIKQVNQQLKNLDRDLTRSKSIVDRLAKQGVDLSDTYTKYQQAVDGLKAVKVDAEAKMAAGLAEDAFTALEDGFFNELDSVMQYQRVIQTMANLSRFKIDFKQGVKQAQNQISALKKQKVDVSELNAILAQTKEQGAVVLNKMKEKPLDEDAVLGELQKMEDLRQQFGDKVEELGGDMSGPLPWEQGSNQFQGQNLQMPKNFGQFMNSNQGGPSFAPGTGPNNMTP